MGGLNSEWPTEGGTVCVKGWKVLVEAVLACSKVLLRMAVITKQLAQL